MIHKRSSIEEIDLETIRYLDIRQMMHPDPSLRPTFNSLQISTPKTEERIQDLSFGIPDPLDQKQSRYLTDFKEIEFVGQGAFGEVVKAINLIDGRNYAVKKIPLKGNVKQQDKIIREVTTLSRLHHQNVVRYYTAWVEGTATNEFESDSESDEDEDGDSEVFCFDQKILFIQMEICEAKTLRHLIDKNGVLSEELVSSISYFVMSRVGNFI